jgi:nitroreductase
MNETIKLIKKRTSLRKYAPEPISKEHLDIILESAMRAPTAGNMMCYSIIVVEDRAKKEILSHSCDEQPFIAKAPVVLIFTADYQKWYDFYRVNEVDKYCMENGMDLFKPSEASLLLAMEDALIAAQNAVVAAESLGIGSCYIGDIMEQYEKHRELEQAIAALEASQLQPGMIAVREERLREAMHGCIVPGECQHLDDGVECEECRMAWLTEQPTDQQPVEGEG